MQTKGYVHVEKARPHVYANFLMVVASIFALQPWIPLYLQGRRWIWVIPAVISNVGFAYMLYIINQVKNHDMELYTLEDKFSAAYGILGHQDPFFIIAILWCIPFYVLDFKETKWQDLEFDRKALISLVILVISILPNQWAWLAKYYAIPGVDFAYPALFMIAVILWALIEYVRIGVKQEKREKESDTN